MAPSCLSRATMAQVSPTSFDAPLNRSISINESDLTLRAAIDRVALASRVRLSYSADLLPANKRVCLNIERMPVGVVLNELLRETSLHAVVLDTENVALSPSRGPNRHRSRP